MKCELCEYEILEKYPICNKCGFDFTRSDFSDHEKLQTYYKALGSDHWALRVDLIGKIYKILSSRSSWGAQLKCAKILNLSPSTVSNHLYVNRFLANNKNRILDILRLKSISQAEHICKQCCIIAGKHNKRLNQYIEEDCLNLKYFVWNFDQNENMYLEDSQKNKIMALDHK